MSKFTTLVKGELLRFKRYNLLAASLFVSAVWVGLLHYLDIENVTKLVPQLIFIDVTTMAMLLVGVTFIYERDEATIRSMLVSPISKSEYILAKMISNIIPSILSLTIMYIYSKLFKNYRNKLFNITRFSYFSSIFSFSNRIFINLLLKRFY